MKQLDTWCSLILSYYKHKKWYSLDVAESETSELFYNRSIDRKLNLDEIYVILEELRRRGNVEWEDKRRNRCLVMWRSPDEWAKLIYKWITERGMLNSVCTYYEITDGDNSKNQEFYGLDVWLLKRALQCLEKEGKAEIFESDDGGVKFF
ncbi:DgyrCDS11112 [Dimorphilus gyrociliatus]|uniref:Vacuolar protein-sorting-associated protein 25 n=1 Tax=Dimorphilus gyrociliatus TaxID=2664684 RepID=A0A7I8W3F3_9ANNE|nr:DgyrCDS11112 [Dimorphilus gyrociliatus]